MLNTTMLFENIVLYVILWTVIRMYHNFAPENIIRVDRKVAVFELWASVALSVIASMMYFRFFYVNLAETVGADAYIGALAVYYIMILPYHLMTTIVAGFRRKWILIVMGISSLLNVGLLSIATYIAL